MLWVCRLRLAKQGNKAVSRSEVNGAWGQCALVLYTVLQFFGVEHDVYRVEPKGPASCVVYRDETVGDEGDEGDGENHEDAAGASQKGGADVQGSRASDFPLFFSSPVETEPGDEKPFLGGCRAFGDVLQVVCRRVNVGVRGTLQDMGSLLGMTSLTQGDDVYVRFARAVLETLEALVDKADVTARA